ncbi:-galactosyl-N-acetylglucosaminide 3-alpha-L-fucosyltransferase 9-like [Scomber scombrus]|uniref:Fucosyltransferase n=1 Tax=Scomber scombrus TaxID=13677 RepID=A0AAV1MRE7_SCOSC
MDSPQATHAGYQVLKAFLIYTSYRKHADIHVRWQLTVNKNTNEDFVLPKKERLLCWIVDDSDLHTESGESYIYFRKLAKHIHVDVFNSSCTRLLRGESYFLTISSCKFYLSFENSIHRYYVTETFSGPLTAGIVPIVLGPPRSN